MAKGKKIIVMTLDSQVKILYNLLEVHYIIAPPGFHYMIARRDRIMDTIKVSGTSRTSAVAGAIAGVFREHQHAEVQAIGAIAVNQAVKAIVLAKGYLKEDGYEIIVLPEFVDVEIEGKVRTAIRFIIEVR